MLKSGGSELRILVADDEKSVVRLLEVCLQRVGFVVTKAFDGEDAYNLILSKSFDVAVLDVLMPSMDGYEILERIRSNPSVRDLPIIFITTQAVEAEKRMKEYDYPATVVSKPFEPQVLIDVIKNGCYAA